MEFIEFNYTESSWDCECCGTIYDMDLVITHNGRELGSFSQDGHFGYGDLSSDTLEKCVVEELCLAGTGYSEMLSQRVALENEFQALYETDEKVDCDKSDVIYDELQKLFENYLKSVGYTIRVTKSYKFDDE